MEGSGCRTVRPRRLRQLPVGLAFLAYSIQKVSQSIDGDEMTKLVSLIQSMSAVHMDEFGEFCCLCS